MTSLFGSSGMRSGGICEPIWTPPAPAARAPTADNFIVNRVDPVGSIFVSMITYPGCTNFEGRKVLVTEWNPFLVPAADPHFLEGAGLIARFEPTDRGFAWARAFAEAICKDYP
jgi:hypothetical protein